MDTGKKKEKPSLIHFAAFTVDLERRGLYRGEERIHLTPKPLETLIYLVENGGRTVEKKELLDCVWKDTFVTEDTLVKAIREIRRALGDDKEDPLYILTIPRQGYRFVGAVSAAPEPGMPGRSSEHAPHDEARRVPQFPWIAVSIVLLALFLVILWLRVPGFRSSPSQPINRATAKLIPTGVASAVKPVISPDGKILLYAAHKPETPGILDLFIRDLSSGAGTWITDKVNASGDIPVFTPDGIHIVFSRYRSGDEGSRLPDLWKVPSIGGAPALYVPEAIGAGFSPDGKWVAFTKYLPSKKPLWMAQSDNLSDHRELADFGFMPRWSPNGKWIAYTTSDPNGGKGYLWVLNSEKMEKRINLTPKPQQIYGLTWIADSRSIIFASDDAGSFQLWKVSIDSGLTTLYYADLDDLTAPHASSDGSGLVFCKARPVRNLVRVDLQGNAGSRQITEDEYHHWPRLSPSGRKVASVLQRREPEESFQLIVTDLRTGIRTTLKEHPVRYPCWIDEDTLACLQTVSQTQTEVRQSSVSSGASFPLTRFLGEATWLSINPDRQRLAVVLRAPDGQERIVLRDMRNNTDSTMAQGANYQHLRWLSDGKSLSWSGPERAADPQSNGVWVLSTGGSRPQRLVQDGYEPVWLQDGSGVYFSRIGYYEGLWRLNLRPAAPAVKVRDWKRVLYFDTLAESFVFTQDSNRSQIYSLALHQ